MRQELESQFMYIYEIVILAGVCLLQFINGKIVYSSRYQHIDIEFIDKLNGKCKIKSNIIDIEFIDKLNGKCKIKSNIIDIE